MNTNHTALPYWSTTALSISEDTLPKDASVLCNHIDHCKVENKRMFAMHCAAEKVHGFVLGRFVTTLVVAFVLIGCYSLAV
jgi:hypothetical protein